MTMDFYDAAMDEYDDGYGNCRGCGGQEPKEILAQMDGYCSSQCEREDRE